MHTTECSNVLYRCRDAEGVLLYVGISHDVDTRMQQHKSVSKAWIGRVAVVETFVFPGFAEAHAAEVAAITFERPLFNRNHNQAINPRPTRPTTMQLLAGHFLGRSLAEYVAEKRSVERPRWSWQNIADQIEADTERQVTVTGESLRLWYGVSDEAVA